MLYDYRLTGLAGETRHRVRWPVGQRVLGLVGGETTVASHIAAMDQPADEESTADQLLLFGRTKVLKLMNFAFILQMMSFVLKTMDSIGRRARR